jgi:hypothetical protein
MRLPALVVARADTSPRGGVCHCWEDIHVNAEFGDNSQGDYAINSRNRYQVLKDGAVRRDGFVDLRIDECDVGFNVFNTAELYLEHEPMVRFKLSAQCQHEFVQLLAKGSFR